LKHNLDAFMKYVINVTYRTQIFP